ncbi:hypothetical protein [Sphingobacterium hotanense]|uniref:hypothetical protein n=1 Tax=Sphingobacterium hotanense TaxID=649196 RepID=UPI0021A89AA3|nr:hypothetical protein [Sphingobacterium hotanense]MCT1526218.1 hypothetical protein [Sphingobacterium hotanense]
MDNSRKCRATGKVIFETLIEAKLTMFRLKWGFRHIKDIYGKRVKHRQGRPVQKRAYYCPHCDGFHLTKWGKSDFKTYQEIQSKGL